jgi:uncharacterized protein
MSQFSSSAGSAVAASPKPYVVKKSRIHGKGLFATAPIAKDTYIGSLEGPRTRRDGPHVLWVFEEDGSVYGIHAQNELKYANHSGRPNAYLDGEEMYALRDIQTGEEITFHYGDDWADVA